MFCQQGAAPSAPSFLKAFFFCIKIKEIVLKVQLQSLAGLIKEHMSNAAAPAGVCVEPVCPVVTLCYEWADG